MPSPPDKGWQKIDVTEDDEGNIEAVNVILSSPVVQAGGTIGEAFGSAIGRAIAGNNQFAQLAAGTVVGAIGKAFGTIVAATPDFDLESMPVDQIFGSFGVNVAGAALGSIASFFTAELGTALHLNGYGAQLFDSAVGSFAGSVLNQVLLPGNTFAGVIGDINWTQAFGQAEVGIATALGSILAHELVPAQNETGAEGGQILGAIGSAIGVALTIGQSLGFVLDTVIPGIGSLIGTIIGTIIGDIIGDNPSYPYDEYSILPANYSYYGNWYYGTPTGNNAVGSEMATVASSVVGGYLSAVNGTALGQTEQLRIGYTGTNVSHPYFWGDYQWVMTDDGNGNLVPAWAVVYHYTATIEDAVNAAALSLLHNTEAVGGDLLMKRAHQASHYSDVVTLGGDLQTAEDYERYLDNRTVINFLIAANPNTAFAAGWAATFARAKDLGLDHYGASDFLGGMVGGYFDSIHKAGLNFTPAGVSFSKGGDGSVTLQIKVGNEVDVPGVLAVFASQTTETDDATGKTIQLKFSDGLIVGGFSGPATASLVSGVWNFTASAGNNIWFGHNDTPNHYVDNQTSSNDVLIGGALGDTIQGGNGANFIDGGAGNDVIISGIGNDILHGGTGSDVMEGSAGNDTYVFDRGDGLDRVIDDYTTTSTGFGGAPVSAHQNGGSDALALGQGISLADLILQMNGNDLILGMRDPAHPNATLSQLTDQITLQNWADPLDRIETILFADGSSLDISGGFANPTLLETAGATRLVQYNNHYYLDGNTGLGAELQYGGAAVAVAQFGGEYAPVGVEQTATGYEVAWRDSVHNTYGIWITDSSGDYLSNKLGNGVWVSPTSVALEFQETSFQQDLNGDGTVGIPNSTVLESSGPTELIQVGNTYYLLNSTSGIGPELMYGSAPVTAGQFGVTEIGTEQTSTGYEVALKNTSTGLYSVWYTDTNGTVAYAPVSGVAGASTLLEAIETSFQQDLNGDGIIGIPNGAAIESAGSTSLVQAGNDYYLLNNTSGIGPELTYGGAAFVAGQWAGWTPIGTEATAGGYEVALKFTSGVYTVWNTDSSGNLISVAIGTAAAASPVLEAIETSFQQDLNGDGIIGLPAGTTLIESAGSTSLVEVGNNYFLDDNSTGAGPEFKYMGAAYAAGQFGAEITLVGVEQTASGYELALYDSFHHTYTMSNVDSSGNFVSNAIGNVWVSGASPLVESQESILHQDINGDGIIGFAAGTTLIESAGSTSLVQAGSNYYLDSNSTGAGPELKYGGAAFVAGSTWGAWAPVAAEAVAGGYEVAFKLGSDTYTVWITDSSGNITTNALGTTSGSSAGLESLEPSFQQDLNGDGVIGYAVPSAGSLELSGAISASVQFKGATGTLTLDNSSQFSGQIFNFTGAGTPSNSDQIDLKDINYSSSSFSHSFNQTTDVLTVSDGSHTAALHFTGSYTAQNFKFASDGANGTIVYDPPASPGGPAVGGASQDAFKFVATNPVLQTLASDLHDAIKAEVAIVKELLGGSADHAPVAGLHDILSGGFEIIEKLLAQHDLHLG